MPQDRLLELLERRPRLEPELLHEASPRRAIHLERLRLASASVERQHAESLEPLAEGVLARQRLELAHELGRTRTREIRFDAPLERDEPKLVETSGRRVQHVTLGDVGQCVTRPFRERLPKSVGGDGGPLLLERACTLGRQALEPMQIEGVALHVDRVAGLSRLDDVAPERLAELRDVSLDDVRSRRRRVVAPQAVDQACRRHNLAGME